MSARQLVIAILASLWIYGCARTPREVAPAQAQTVILSAAASTSDVIGQLAKQFEADSGIAVKINRGASSSLANQIINGAPVDLFLSANLDWAREVDNAGLAAEQVRLLTNRLVLVVPAGNPASVHGPPDLLSAKVKKVALAGETVPAGVYAAQALTRLGILEPLEKEHRIARGHDVRSALSYVERGEAEAGIVYSTDLAAAPQVQTVYEFDPALHDEIAYVLVRIRSRAEHPAALRLFEFLQSPQADPVYAKFGFQRLTEPAASN